MNRLSSVKHLSEYFSVSECAHGPKDERNGRRRKCRIEFKPRVWTIQQRYLDGNSKYLNVIIKANLSQLCERGILEELIADSFNVQTTGYLIDCLTDLIASVGETKAHEDYSTIIEFLDRIKPKLASFTFSKPSNSLPPSSNPTKRTAAPKPLDLILRTLFTLLSPNPAFLSSIYNFGTKGLLTLPNHTAGRLVLTHTGLYIYPITGPMSRPTLHMPFSSISNLHWDEHSLILHYHPSPPSTVSNVIMLRTFLAMQIVEDILSYVLMDCRMNRLGYYLFRGICKDIDDRGCGDLEGLVGKDNGWVEKGEEISIGGKGNRKGNVNIRKEVKEMQEKFLKYIQGYNKGTVADVFEDYEQKKGNTLYPFRKEYYDGLIDQRSDCNQYRSFTYILPEKQVNKSKSASRTKANNTQNQKDAEASNSQPSHSPSTEKAADQPSNPPAVSTQQFNPATNPSISNPSTQPKTRLSRRLTITEALSIVSLIPPSNPHPDHPPSISETQISTNPILQSTAHRPSISITQNNHPPKAVVVDPVQVKEVISMARKEMEEKGGIVSNTEVLSKSIKNAMKNFPGKKK